MSAVATAPPDSLARLQRLVAEREVLRAGFAQIWPLVRNAALLEAWAAASLELALVNAGPGCIIAFWQASATAPLRAVIAGGRDAAEICRHAGARAARACLEALPAAIRLTRGDPLCLAGWWRGLLRLAREAPELVGGVAARIEILLAEGDGAGFADFVAAGLKATATERRRRAAFFALDDALAKSMLRRGAGFAESERMLVAFVAGLWGGIPRLQAAPAGTRRTMIASGAVLLPERFSGIPAESLRALYRAAAAHAHAHLALPAVRHEIGQLKPLQLALIGLIEDARVEALAIQRFPGLRRLWAGFHVAQPGGALTCVNLMARLARALLDPAYQDSDGFVEKGRALFAEAAGRIHDPTLSRALGGLLGNDLGQMRLQFNAKTYVVEPAYRDDNMHLWALPDAPDDAFSLTIDSARAQDGEGKNERAGEGTPAPRARDAGEDAQGLLLATYPEWDAAAGVERADWTSLRDTLPVLRQPPPPDAAESLLRARVARLVRGIVVGQPIRQPRQEDGEVLDMDAAIAAAVARRAGLPPDARVYRDRRPRGRDLATLIILDVSQSTAAVSAAGLSVLDAQRRAVEALAGALALSGDCFALRAFASAGREDVRLTRLKDFCEPFGPPVLARLAGLSSGLSTRLGAALRHSGAELAAQPFTRKMILVLSDGEPSDIDVPRPDELVEDARRAVRGLRQRGIDVFGLVMDPTDAGSGAAIFGAAHTMPIRRLEELPARLAGVYFRLAQR